MKRFTIVIMSIIACVCMNGAPDNFTVKAPSWTKVAWNPSEEGAIIYKTPSDHAPRLVYNWAKMVYMNPYSTSKWTTARLTDGEDYLTLGSIPCPVISEKDGWYEIPDVNYTDSKSENGWVKTSSCASSNLTPVYPGRYNRYNFQWVDSPGDPAKGNYAMYVDHDSRGGGVIYVGREINGVVVCPYRLDYTFHYSDSDDGILFDFGDFKMTLNYDQCDGDCPDLTKIPYDTKKMLFSKAKKTTRPVVVYFGNTAGELQYYSTTVF